MSGFKVYAVSYAKQLKKAKKYILTGTLSPEHWEEACHEEAATLYATANPVAVSDPFDAPQFAKEFISLADKTKFKIMSIYAYQPTGKKIMKGKKQGQDHYKWMPYRSN